MRALSLLYHDVVFQRDVDVTGFPGAGAAVYKLELQEFVRQLGQLSSGQIRSPESVIAWNGQDVPGDKPLFLTFDDGGVSAYTIVRQRLSELGWVGHFFVTADRVGTQGFLNADQIRALHAEGHVIGSHSWSHPARMSACDDDALGEEWRRSTQYLSDIINEQVRVASVPGGYYSSRVARTAAESGIRFLFTSEPTQSVARVGDCVILGRYSITRRTRTSTVSGLVKTGFSTVRITQSVSWRARKLMKVLLGSAYISGRERVLSLRGQGRRDSRQENLPD